MKYFFPFFVFCTVFFPTVLFAQEEVFISGEAPAPIQDTFYRARVLEVIDTSTEEEFGQVFTRQQLRVQLKSGDQQGREVEVMNEVNQQSQERLVDIGDGIIVGEALIAGELTFYMSDVYRLNAIYIVFVLFVLLVLAVIRGKGVRAFLGLGVSFAVIVWYLIPGIIEGGSPLFLSFVSACLIACLSLFVAHGVHLRSTIAFVGTMLSVVFSLLLSTIVVKMTVLSGLGTEEAFYLQFADMAAINLQGLLIGGIVIGTLGVLDDITTSQTAAVEQIHLANTTLSFWQLYKRGTAVGREHIISLVNTLVLAYTGVGLPLLLLFSTYTQPVWVTINNEIFIEEVIRMIIGSMALVIAVPLTTLIAAYCYSKRSERFLPRLSWCPLFRPAKDGHTHHHHH